MAQLADAVGSKPAALRGMWVRIPLRAPTSHRLRQLTAWYAFQRRNLAGSETESGVDARCFVDGAHARADHREELGRDLRHRQLEHLVEVVPVEHQELHRRRGGD